MRAAWPVHDSFPERNHLCLGEGVVRSNRGGCSVVCRRPEKISGSMPRPDERRPHLAGTLGCVIYKRSRKLGLLVPVRDTRVLRVRLEGRAQLWKLLGIAVA